jgi:hypothetical protein
MPFAVFSSDWRIQESISIHELDVLGAINETGIVDLSISRDQVLGPPCGRLNVEDREPPLDECIGERIDIGDQQRNTLPVPDSGTSIFACR